MIRLMQTASALTLAVALAAAPVIATAQQATETDAEKAVEGAAQETNEAAGEATETTGQAAEQTGEAVEGAAEATGNAAENAAEATGEAAQDAAQATQEAGQEAGQAVEQTVEGTGQPTGETVVTPTTEAEVPVEEVEGTIVMQDEDTILANDLIGATVYNAADETVGEINDAIISLDGTVDGVVIGVGGFLGIGEKSVAIELQHISVQMDEDDDPRLIIDTTRESLEAAPEFVTVEDQRDEAAATTGAMAPAGTAPTTGMAPAGTTPAAEGTTTEGTTATPTQ